MKVLVAYATSHGSTADVARHISEVLQQKGHSVTVENAKNVINVEGYEAFVLGTAIESGTWLPDLVSFVDRFAPQLADKPAYVWLSCIRVMEEYGMSHCMHFYMPSETLAKLNVRNKTALAGKLELQAVDWTERWTLSTRYDGHAWPTNFDGDFRDWNKTAEWANEVAADLETVAVHG